MGERAFLSATGMNGLNTMQEVVESSTSKHQLLLLPGHCNTREAVMTRTPPQCIMGRLSEQEASCVQSSLCLVL